MDKFTKDKAKQINKLASVIRYELKHMKHLLYSKHPRTVRNRIKRDVLIGLAVVRCKSVLTQIEIIRSTPRPKYPSGGSCGIIDERGPEMVISGCNPNLINPIQSISIQKNKVVRVNDMPLAAHHSMHISLCGPPKK